MSRYGNRAKVAAVTEYTSARTARDPIWKALRALPDEIQDVLRETSYDVASGSADVIRGAALEDGEQSALVAPSVAATYGRTPGILAGGSARIPGKRATYSDIFYGANFGSIDYHQFRIPLGDKEDYWFYDAFYGEVGTMFDAYRSAVSDVVDAFERVSDPVEEIS